MADSRFALTNTYILHDYLRRIFQYSRSKQAGRSRCLVRVFQHTRLIAVPVPLFNRRTLVVFSLAGCQCDLALDPVVLPIERDRDTGLALLLCGADQACDFFLVQQQLARSHGFGIDMGGGGRHGGDCAA